MTTLALEARGLVVSTSGHAQRIGPLDLEVPVGAYVLLSGASGAGKTTLLRAIAGLATPIEGTLRLFGEVCHEGDRERVPPERRGVGMVFQGGAHWPHLSAIRTLEFVLAARGVPRSERAARARRHLGDVGLHGLDDRLPGKLSGGEAQRLALARALAGEPRLLLLDEPLGPLDRTLRSSLLTYLDGLRKRLALTVVHVTHDPEEALELADRKFLMQDGLVVEAPAP